jgi:hypothetical protein
MVAKLILVECMAAIEDPRIDRTKAHDLQDIQVLCVPAVLCGTDGWEDIEFLPKSGLCGSRSSSIAGTAFHPAIPSADSFA